ncbi:hypothetical protein GCM10009067_37340 [Haloarcula sebkhae]|uniref:Uncharacterized protein n=1 Tax=Haloarcula sebkhae TaxID=932660 RepID=A0A830EQX9_9EURY|nr:hypothetical protein GCM10009067_37340 [Haloarcula sebkhae]
MTDFSLGHYGKTTTATNYLPIMTLLQTISGDNRHTLFAVVLRPALSIDRSQSYIAPVILGQWSDSYPGATTGLERDSE